MTTPTTHGIHHLGLSVADLAEARDFFTDALHFELLGEDADYPAAFVSDSVIVITLWAAEPGAMPFDRHRQIGLHHAAFLVDTLEALQSLYERLAVWPGTKVECEISPPSGGSKARHFLIRMPGGPRIEFYVPQAVR